MYYVYGAEWTDTNFVAYQGNTMELHGPFETETEAMQVWRSRAWATVDFCYYRFTVVANDYTYAEMFSLLR